MPPELVPRRTLPMQLRVPSQIIYIYIINISYFLYLTRCAEVHETLSLLRKNCLWLLYYKHILLLAIICFSKKLSMIIKYSAKYDIQNKRFMHIIYIYNEYKWWIYLNICGWFLLLLNKYYMELNIPCTHHKHTVCFNIFFPVAP